MEKRVWATCWENSLMSSHGSWQLKKRGFLEAQVRRSGLLCPHQHLMVFISQLTKIIIDKRKTHPCEDGEEGKGYGCPSCIPSFPEGIVFLLGDLPLVGQEAETHKPHEGPECWKNKVKHTGSKFKLWLWTTVLPITRAESTDLSPCFCLHWFLISRCLISKKKIIEGRKKQGTNKNIFYSFQNISRIFCIARLGVQLICDFLK